MLGKLLSPRWLAAHVFVVAVVAVCVALGLWQLRRMEERRALNATLEQRAALPAVELAGPVHDRQELLVHRSARALGEYDPAREVLVAGRAREGRPGHHVLTPLVTEEGWAVLVERGWIPYELDRPPVARAAPPEGRVVVEGLVLRSEDSGVETPSALLRRPDVALVAEAVPYPLEPFYLRLERQDPPQPGELPALVPPPEPSSGPHLGYAVQWFLFGATALAVYGALLRRERRGPATRRG